MIAMNSLRKMRDQKAFTLIELLVVIAIIAVLLAVLMPALQAAKEAAKTVACASNLKQWNMSIKLFAEDHDDRFPDADWNDDGRNDPRGMWWLLPLRPYYEDQPDILICKKAVKKQNLNSAETWVADGRYFTKNQNECWGRRIMESTDHPDVGQWVWSSYAPNAWIMDPRKGTYGSPVSDPRVYWGKFVSMTVPSRVPVFLDSSSVDVWPQHTDIPNSLEQGVSDGRGYMRAVTLLRHNKSINSVFGDGHVSKVRLTELWRLKWYKDFDMANPYNSESSPWPVWMR